MARLTARERRRWPARSSAATRVPKSALIPLLHLAQEQDGYVTDDAMDHIAELVGVTPAEVLGTCSFYEMFKREPVGQVPRQRVHEHLLQLIGGEELLAPRRGDARHQGRQHHRRRHVHPRGRRVHRGLHRGAVPPGQLPLLPPDHPRRVRPADRRPARRPARRRDPAARHARPHPPAHPRPTGPPATPSRGAADEPVWIAGTAADAAPEASSMTVTDAPKIITTPLRATTTATRSTRYVATGGYEGLQGRARPRRPTEVVDEVKARQPARPRRRRLPGRRQVGLLPARRVAALPRRQRRRVRAGHLQGPPPHGARSAPAHRGRAHRLLRRRLPPGLPLRPGRDGPRPGAHRRRPSTRPTPPATSARTSSAPTSPSTSSCTGAPAPTSWARRRRSSRASRATGACPASSRRSSRRPRACTCSRPSSTTSRRWPTSRGSSATAATRSPSSAPRLSKGTRMFAVSGHVKQPRRVRGRVRRHHLPRPASTPRSTAAASAAASELKAFIPGGASAPWFYEEHLDLPLEAGAVDKAGSMLGSGAIVVMDETTDMVKACLRVVRFFARESCGKCTPCREGTSWLEKILRAHPRRPRPARATSTCCSTCATTSAPASPGRPKQTTICPLGPSAVVADRVGRSCGSATSSRPTSAAPARSPSRSTARPTSAPSPTGRRPMSDIDAATETDRVRSPSTARPSRPSRRAGHRRRRAQRRLHPALLLPPAHGAGRHVPDVHRRDRHRPRPGAPAQLHDRPCAPDMKVDTESPGDQEGPGRRPRVPARSTTRSTARCATRAASARCRTRRMAYGPGESRVRRGEAALREADPDQRPRAPRPRALHPLRPLHPVRQGRGRRPADPLPGPRQRDRGQHLPRPAVRLVLQRQHRADLPGRRPHRQALPLQGPPVGPRRRSSPPARAARSAAASSIAVVAATRCCATRASTSTRSTGAGCATRAASASRPSTATTASATRWSRDGDDLRRDPLGRGARPRPPTPLQGRVDRRGPASIAVLGGARLTNEAAYAWAKLAKGVIGTDNVDAQLGDGLPAEVVLGLPRATIDERVRPRRHRPRARPRPQGGAAGPVPAPPPRRRRATASRSSSSRRSATGSPSLRRRVAALPPGRGRRRSSPRCSTAAPRPDVGGVDADALARGRGAARRRPGHRRPRPASRWPSRPTPSSTPPPALLAAHPDVRFLAALRRANVHGALDMGLAPACCPAGSPSTTARDWFAGVWPDGARPSRPRRRRHPRRRGRRPDRRARAARRRPAGRLPRPRPRPPRRSPAPARSSPSTRFLNASSRQADVVLPAAGYAEVDGTTTNIEGRVSVAQPEGHAARHRPRRLDDRRRAGLPPRRRPRPRVGRRRSGPRSSGLAPAHAGITVELLGRRRPRRRRRRRCPAVAAPTGEPTGRATPAPTTPTPTPPTAADDGRRRRAGRGRSRPPRPRPTRPTPTAADDADAEAAPSPAAAAPAARPASPFAAARLRAARRSTPTRCGSSPPASSTTRARSCSTPPSLAGLAAGHRRCAVNPARPRPPRRRRRRPGHGHVGPRLAHHRRSRPTPACPRHRRRVVVNQGGPSPGRADRRRRAGHRRPGGDARHDARHRSAPRRRHRPRRSSLIVLVKVVITFVLPARRHDVDDLVRAQGHRRHAEPHRPEPGRARSASSRPWPTASSSSSRRT